MWEAGSMVCPCGQGWGCSACWLGAVALKARRPEVFLSLMHGPNLPALLLHGPEVHMKRSEMGNLRHRLHL